MSTLRSAVLAVLASTVVGVAPAAACATADLAGEWAATFQKGAGGYCTLTVDATGAITSSNCWLEKLKPNPQFVLTGALAVSDTCKVTGQLTGAASASTAAYTAGAKAAQVSMQGKGGGKGNNMSVTVAGRLLTGNELIHGLFVWANGEFGAAVLTRSL